MGVHSCNVTWSSRHTEQTEQPSDELRTELYVPAGHLRHTVFCVSEHGRAAPHPCWHSSHARHSVGSEAEPSGRWRDCRWFECLTWPESADSGSDWKKSRSHSHSVSWVALQVLFTRLLGGQVRQVRHLQLVPSLNVTLSSQGTAQSATSCGHPPNEPVPAGQAAEQLIDTSATNSIGGATVDSSNVGAPFTFNAWIN